MAQRPKYRTFDQNFNFILRREHQKNFLWSSRLWVGRWKDLILGYVPKKDEKKNLVHKGLRDFFITPWSTQQKSSWGCARNTGLIWIYHFSLLLWCIYLYNIHNIYIYIYIYIYTFIPYMCRNEEDGVIIHDLDN